jgi:hypothetical protein
VKNSVFTHKILKHWKMQQQIKTKTMLFLSLSFQTSSERIKAMQYPIIRNVGGDVGMVRVANWWVRFFWGVACCVYHNSKQRKIMKKITIYLALIVSLISTNKVTWSWMLRVIHYLLIYSRREYEIFLFISFDICVCSF